MCQVLNAKYTIVLIEIEPLSGVSTRDSMFLTGPMPPSYSLIALALALILIGQRYGTVSTLTNRAGFRALPSLQVNVMLF